MWVKYNIDPFRPLVVVLEHNEDHAQRLAPEPIPQAGMRVEQKVEILESIARIFVVVGSVSIVCTWQALFLIIYPGVLSGLQLSQFEMVTVWIEIAPYWVFLALSISLVMLSPILVVRKRKVEVDKGDLRHIVAEASNTLGLRRVPRVLLEDSEDLNCLVFGVTSRDAKLLISKGTISLLEQDELKAVILHELSHIKNKDMGLATWGIYFRSAVKYWFAFYLMSIVILMLVLSAVRGSAVDPITILPSMVFTFFTMALFPILVVDSGLRNRELLADARVTLYSTHKKDLMSAIRKVGSKVLKTSTLSLDNKKSRMVGLLSRVKNAFGGGLPSPLSSLLRTRPSPLNRWIALVDDRLLVGGEKICLPSKESSIYVGILGFYTLIGGLGLFALPFYWLTFEKTISPVILIPVQVFGFLLFFVACPLLFFFPNYRAVKNWDPKCFNKLSNKDQLRYLTGLIGHSFLSLASFVIFTYSVTLNPPVIFSEGFGALLVMAILYFLVSVLLSLGYSLIRLGKRREPR
jgi:heat shock protein HtpX